MISPTSFNNAPVSAESARPGLWMAGALLLHSLSRANGMNFDIQTLFEGLGAKIVQGNTRTTISALCTDSRRVAPGALFFAMTGARTDGNYYVEEAIHRGAAAIVSEEPPGRLPSRVTFVQVKNIRKTLAEVARRFHNSPDNDLELAGVTGTNGKTTVTTLCKHLLEEGSEKVGLIGTVSYDLGIRTLPASRTTPESSELYSMLAQMRDSGCRKAMMEVSSHGIDQDRVWQLPLKIAVFTNLTQDHIDYHHSMEEYFQVKSRLFNGETGVAPQIAVINSDDAYGRRLISGLPTSTRLVTFGENPDADFRAESLRLTDAGTAFVLNCPEGRFDVVSPLLGRYNVSNVLAAIAITSSMGLPVATAVRRLISFPGVPGRMERVDGREKFNVLVDYAHTPDALSNALEMLRPITRGRLLVVFGCGGNRDRGKRPLMTKAVQEVADEAWATADNPRGESIQAIFDDMRGGVLNPAGIHWVEDRRRAIHLALAAAQPGDTVLIAGKGHETYQEFSDTVAPFDDRQVARELLKLKASTGELK